MRFGTQTMSEKDNNKHEFEYRIRTSEFTDCDMAFAYDYVLDIEIKDECAVTVIDQVIQTNNSDILNPQIVNTQGTIHNNISGNTDLTFEFTSYLGIGSYTSGKHLAVDPVKLEDHVAVYIDPSNNCILSESDFLENNVGIDCYDPLPLSLDISVNNCMVSTAMMLADLSPSGQYGSDDPSDVLSVFAAQNALDRRLS